MRLTWFDRNGKNTAVLGDRSKSDTPRKAGGLIGIGFHLVSLRILGIFLMGNVPFQPLSLGSGVGLLIGNFPNEGSSSTHPSRPAGLQRDASRPTARSRGCCRR